MARRRLKVGSADAPFQLVPRRDWPDDVSPPRGLVALHRNARFLVFECLRTEVRLLMVQRIDGRAGITWDELYAVKAGVGYADAEAVEVYPEASRLINDANMRHLWVFPYGIRLPFGLDHERAGR